MFASLPCFPFVVALCLLGDEKSTGTPPASVENRVKESDLTVVKLTPEAEKRLGIALASAQLETVEESVLRPGVVEVPIGRSITLRAPIAGRVTSVLTNDFDLAQGEVLLGIEPGRASADGSFVPADRIQLAKARADLAAGKATAEGDLESARARAEAATLAAKRAELLAQQGPGSQKALEEARGELAIANAAAHAAQLRIEVYSRTLAAFDSSQSTAIELTVPFAATLQSLAVASGQIVESGAMLAEIAAHDVVWIRVPLADSEVAKLSVAKPVGLESPSGIVLEGITLDPVAAPPRARASSVTIDRVVSAKNEKNVLIPGQRIAVRLAFDSRQALTIPRSAIVYDIHGGAWAYESVATNQFARRRVEVQSIKGDKAILARGLKDGSRVVTAGAAELFGTEFGAGK